MVIRELCSRKKQKMKSGRLLGAAEFVAED